MQTVLFSNNKLISESQRMLGYLSQRKCKIVRDLSRYETLLGQDADQRFHIESVIGSKQADREYASIFGNTYDSHNEIEKLGVCDYIKSHITIVSLEDSLDYILHRLSGCSVENIRNIPKYKDISRAILKLNFEVFDNFNFEVLNKADDKLATYLVNLYDKGRSDDQEETENNFVTSFMKDVLQDAEVISTYVAMWLHTSLPKDTSVIRSKSLCNYVLTTSSPVNHIVDLVSEGHDSYSLMVRSFEPYEYLEGIDLRYCC